MNKLMTMCGLAALLAGGAQAVPFNAGQTVGNSKWVLHLDVDGLKNTQLGKILLQRLNSGDENNKLNALAAFLGSDLRKDLGAVTLSGMSDLEDENLVVFRGRFNKQQLETFVKANKAYQGETYRGETVHSWIDEKKNKRMFGAILGGGETIVMSGANASVRAQLDALAGQGPTLAKENASDLSLNAANNPVVIASADLANLNRKKPNAQTLKQAKAAAASIGEEGPDMVGRISLVADSAESAKHLNDAARGILAMIQLDDKTDQKTKDAFRATTVDLDGSTLKVTIHLPAQTLADEIQKKWKEEDAKKAAAAAAGTEQK